eukprot:CAMPEP_0177623714 /NCGR_PEP_ID=MMETSP0419_2-20121207/29050_1 /TAXON_ID=582737 /ORGANISM="Tetraselmis sp., Strain GSL018" /LENGTH=344 /DNA_ID=CAMNT_0019124285 /DNA_START=140 /DNA_END=1176 /DNA_ORIENTATION=+
MVEREERVTPLRVTDELLGVQKWQEYEGSLEFDIGNMAAFEPSALKTEEFDCPEKREDVCQKLAQEITQSLVAKIFAYSSRSKHPSTAGEASSQAPATDKVEIFAQQKGIQKKKRSKLLYDESSGEWRRRYGYKKANNDEDIPIIEATSDDKVGTDPFTQARKEKKERVAKNAKQQKENLKRSAKAGGKSVLPASLQLVTDLGTGPGKERSARRRHLKDEIKAASKTAGLATASVGKFDRQARGEKPGDGSRGSGSSGTALFDGSEGRRAAGVADRIIREKSDDVDLNVEKAVGRFEAEARELRHSAKKQRANSKAGGGGKGPRGKGGRSGGDKPQGKAGKRRK